MQKFSDWRVGTRLGTAFAALLLFTAVVGVIGMASMSVIEQNLGNVVTRIYPLTHKANETLKRLTTQVTYHQQLLLRSDAETVARLNQLITENRLSIGSLLGELDKGVRDTAARTRLEKYTHLRADYHASSQRILKAVSAGNQAQAVKEYLEVMDPLQQEMQGVLSDLVQREHALMQQSHVQAEDAYRHARMLMLSLMMFATLLGACVAWFMTRGVTRPLTQAVALAQRVAAGDLTGKLPHAAKDEMGQLLRALNAMNASLRQTVARVRRGAETISSATSEIAVGNEDLSTRTEEQACSLQETAASMEEMTSTVKNNAEHASQANTLFASAKDLAQQSVERIGEVSQTMRMITESSQRMGEIVSVIDSIAFQTNILALNASVEAARAGEQGRGFAVVASEVRNLAQRSAASAKEIKALIDDSMEKVKHGDALVVQAENIVRKMGEDTQPVISLVSEIAQASQEQSEGIVQINLAIAQIDSTTQQNAALVEQAAAAAASLREQAEALVQTVQHFSVGNEIAEDNGDAPVFHDATHAGA